MKNIIIADFRYSWKLIALGTVLMTIATFLLLSVVNSESEFATLMIPQAGMMLLALIIIPQLAEKRTRFHSSLPLAIGEIAKAKFLFLAFISTAWAILVTLVGVISPTDVSLHRSVGIALVLVGFSVLPNWLTELKMVYPKKVRALLSIFISVPLTLLMFVALAMPLGQANPIPRYFFEDTAVAEQFLTISSSWLSPLIQLAFISFMIWHSIYLYTRRKSYIEKELGLS
jgi:hypothetical protein